MLKITKKGDYGLTMLTVLADNPSSRFIPLRTIALNSHLPYKFISQIALLLKDAGIVKSKEGIGGGYRLSQLPQKITIGHVLEVLEGPIAPVACLRGKKCLNQTTCQHRQIMVSLALVIRQNLASLTLADLTQ